MEIEVVLLKTCMEMDLTRVLTLKPEHRSVLMSSVTIRGRNTFSEVLNRETLNLEPSLDLNLKKSDECNHVLQHHGRGVTMETLSPPAILYVLWTSSRAFDHYLLNICFSVISVTQPAGFFFLSEKVSRDSEEGFVLKNTQCSRALLAASSQHQAEQNRARLISQTGDQFKDSLEKHQRRCVKEPLKFKYAAKKNCEITFLNSAPGNCQHNFGASMATKAAFFTSKASSTTF